MSIYSAQADRLSEIRNLWYLAKNCFKIEIGIEFQ